MANSVFLYSGYTLLLEKDVISQLTLNIADGDHLLLKTGGAASEITVSKNCLLEMENGSRADRIRLLSEGICLVNTGACLDFLTIDNGGICNLHGDLDTADISGALYLYDNASLCTASVNAGALLSLWGSDCIADDIIVCGTASVYHGIISNAFAMNGGRIRLGNDATANDITIYDGCIDVAADATIDSLTAMADAFVRIAPGATLTGIVCLSTPLSLTGKINADSADFILIPEELTDIETPMISDWTLCTPHSLSISISEELHPGKFIIANHPDTITSIPIIDQRGAELGKCTTTSRFVCDQFILSLEISDDSLSFCSKFCTFTQINSNLTLRSDDDGIAIFCQDKDSIEAHSWGNTPEVPENIATYMTPNTTEWNASSLETPAIFFAQASSTWGHDYLAFNINTNERKSMTDKNRFESVFIGASSPSLLMLTSENDAIFADDIFTPFPESAENQSRLSSLAEIRAENGDDIIDMTAEHFPDTNKDIALRGGCGNDVIWAANDGSRLFGDLGDDQLTGGLGNDILCGGAGNDTLRGLDGFDIYAFGFDAGNDTIILDDGDFILWFEEGIRISEEDIAIEGNKALISFGMLASVTIENLPDDRLMERIITGDDGYFENMTYAPLAALGAFDSDSSSRIFNAIA